MFDITQKVESNGAAEAHPRDRARWPVRPTAPCVATYGETTVLATVVFAKEPKPGQDFFPLTVNYQEKVLRRRPASRAASSSAKAARPRRRR